MDSAVPVAAPLLVLALAACATAAVPGPPPTAPRAGVAASLVRDRTAGLLRWAVAAMLLGITLGAIVRLGALLVA